jgi:hypothetical protein
MHAIDIPIPVRVIATAVLAAALLVGVSSVSADTGGSSFTTTPVVLNISAKPGSSNTQTLQFLNNGTQAVPIDMMLDVFSAKDASGNAVITAPSPNDPSTSWVSFNPSHFIARPGVWSSVKMTIALPSTAEFGYYYAVLFKPNLPSISVPGTTSIHGTNSTLVLVDTHSAGEERNLSIESFSADQGLFEYLPASFHARIRNSGNIYMSPVGNIFISPNSDMTNSIAAIDINPASGNILPRTVRNFQASWTDGFPKFENKTVNGQTVNDSHGVPVQELSWDSASLSKFRFGKYYAQLTLVYNDGTKIVPLHAEVSFWVIPWKLILFVLIVIAIIVIGLLTIGKFGVRLIRRTKVYHL